MTVELEHGIVVAQGGAAPGPVTLFRSEDLFVKGYFGRRDDICLVVFDPMREDLSLDREAFGERFLAAYGYDAVHVVSARNAWFQDPLLPEALAHIRERTRPYRRVIAYGSSMGGYAALRFADRVGATSAIAISPQYSVHPAIAPTESRWPLLRQGLDWLHEAAGTPLPALAEAVVLYDPSGSDGWHAEAVRRDLPHAQMVPLRHGGHPVTAMLAEAGLLSTAILDAIHGRLDGPALREAARRQRHRSAHYLAVLARRQPRSRPRLKADIAARAALLRPSAAFLSYAALVRECAGPHETALALHAEAIQGEPFSLAELRRARSLWRAGQTSAARAAVERARQMRPLDPTPVELGALMAGIDGAPAEALALAATLPRVAKHPLAIRLLQRWSRSPALASGVARAIGRRLAQALLRFTVLAPGGLWREVEDADGEAG